VQQTRLNLAIEAREKVERQAAEVSSSGPSFHMTASMSVVDRAIGPALVGVF
jgi:hypothetical protein